MFHHFFSEKHPRGQGAISAHEFEKMLTWLEYHFTILSPDDFTKALAENKLESGQICLTFDDSLLCQYDVALPVLESKNLKAFFNIYSSAFSGNPDPLEVFRYFRTVQFSSIEDFYSEFFGHLHKSIPEIYREGIITFQRQDSYLRNYPFYSINDKKFRFLRDYILGRELYNSLMWDLIKNFKFDASCVPDKVFMSTEQLISLQAGGHKIGLHSHTHPTQFSSLTYSAQKLEYAENLNFLVSEVGVKADSMAHPCGSYNLETIQILRELEIKIGFGSSLNTNIWGTEFEIPREDHMTIQRLVLNS